MKRPTTLLIAALAAAALFGLTIGLARRRKRVQSAPPVEGGTGEGQGAASYASYNGAPDCANDSEEGPWPCCVGRDGNWCMDHLVALDNDLDNRVFVLPEGSIVTADWDEERVRIFVDEEGIVVGVPARG